MRPSVLPLLFLVLVYGSSGQPIDDSELRQRIACENQELSIECAPSRIIHITSALYGRSSWSVCPSERFLNAAQRDELDALLPCTSSKSLQVVTERCDNRNSCSLLAVLATFRSSGMCSGIPSYLEVKFYCVPINSPPVAQRVVSEPRLTGDACPPILRRGVFWPPTAPGRWAHVKCPDSWPTGGKNASWFCSSNPVAWKGRPKMKNCYGKAVAELHTRLKLSHANFEPNGFMLAAGDMAKLFHSGRQMYGGDLDIITDAMSILVGQINVELEDSEHEAAIKGSLRKVFESVVSASDEILSDDFNEVWLDLRPVDRHQAASRILQTLEMSAFQLARTSEQPQTLSSSGLGGETAISNVTSKNIALEVGTVGGSPNEVLKFPRSGNLHGTRWQNVRNHVQLSNRAVSGITTPGGRLNVMFAMFNNLEAWLAPTYELEESAYDVTPNSTEGECVGDCPLENIVNTNVITVAIGLKRPQSVSLSEPIRFVLEHKQTVNVSNPQCSFWKFSNSSSGGEWSTEGCWLIETNETHTTCECNHLTSFAVLMSPTAPQISEANAVALSVITYIGCMISVICLAFAFVTFQFCKSLHGDRNTVHKNLVLNLFIANVLFMSGISAYNSPIVCAIVAGFLHYFFLTSFAWMLLEGVQLYVMLVEVFEAERSRIKWYYLTAYGGPAVIVGVSAAVYHQGYGTPDYCWLTVEKGFIWAFIGPVVCIILVNAGMLGVALHSMYQHTKMAASWRKEKSKVEQMRSWVKGAIVLEVLLGLTWAFGLSYISAQTIVFAYIFTILNSLQGAFIFIFHCAMNEKVRLDYQRMIRRCKFLPESVRVRFGGARMSVSTNPNSSGGGNNYWNRLLPSRRRHSSSSTSLSKSNSVTANRKSLPAQKDEPPSNAAVCSLTGTDSGIDDPSSYMEPAGIMLGESEFHDFKHELSMIEGSVVDTDFVISMTRPSSQRSKSSDLNSPDRSAQTVGGRSDNVTSNQKAKQSRHRELVESSRPEPKPEPHKSRTVTISEPSSAKRPAESLSDESSVTDSAVRDLSSHSNSLNDTKHSQFCGRVTSC